MRAFPAVSRIGTVAALAVLMGAGASLAATAPSPPPAQAPELPPVTAAQGQSFLAAAEPFETLTEKAFTASPEELGKSLASAESNAAKVRDALPRQAWSELDSHLSALKAAHQKRDRADVALSSVEAYRVLVSAAASGGLKVPVEVNLLDYAGFRYNADLKASPARWNDMVDAVNFAERKWEALAPRVKSPALHAKVRNEIAAMSEAAQSRNKPAASKAVTEELNLVDELEKHFSAA